MRFGIVVILMFMLSIVMTSFVLAEEVKVNRFVFVDVNDYESLSGDKSFGEMQNKIGSILASKIIYYFVDNFDGSQVSWEKMARSKFLQLELDTSGIPILNLLVFYSVSQKEIRIVYPDGCIYNKSELDNLAKNAARKMKESGDYSELIVLDKKLFEISVKKLEKIVDNPVLSCPAPETKKYEIKKIEGDGDYCKAYYEEDKFDSSRLKVLVLGKDFESKKELRNAVDKHVLKDGFQKIEPFKSYTKDGKGGLFYFVLGDYDIEVDVDKFWTDRKEVSKKMGDEIKKCPNVFYTIFLYNNVGHKDFKSFYAPELKTSFNVVDGVVVMHETGHRFQLSDEYYVDTFDSFVREEIGESVFGISCYYNPKKLDDALKEYGGSYDFRSCGGRDDMYRSSFGSIMRSSYSSKMFNALSCLYLVREFERANTIVDKKVRDVCLGLHKSGYLQKSDEVAEESVEYKNCVLLDKGIREELRDGLVKLFREMPAVNVDCEGIVLKCSKDEGNPTGVTNCIDKLVSEKYLTLMEEEYAKQKK